MNKLEIARLHAKTSEYKYKLKKSIAIMSEAFLVLPIEKWHVSFSGGKDSTVVANLLPLPRLYVDEEWLLPETEDYLQRTPGLHRVKSRDQHAWFFTSWETDNEAWDSKDVFEKYAYSQGWCGVFLGLRKEESSIRDVHLSTHGTLFFNKRRQRWQCSPLANWSWKDVWAFIVSNGLDYNRAYDILDEIGVAPQYQRIGPLAQQKVLHFGQIKILQRGWPDLFNEFVAKYPEARAYV